MTATGFTEPDTGPVVSDSPAVAIRHVLLFGASNLVLGWPALTRQLQQQIAQPLHIHTCLGMGRSYIRPSRCLARVLPGVLESRLWQNLPRPAAAPPLVLLTDVGNDIIYRFSVTDIQQAVAETIRRIRAWDARADIVLTGLPVQALDDLTPFRFQIARRLLFQGSPLTLPEAQQQAHELQQLLGQLATAQRLQLAQPDRVWYGLDPIHYRRRFRDTAFQTYFSRWTESTSLSDSATADLSLPAVAPPLPTSADVTRRGRLTVTPQPVFHSRRLQVSAW